MANRTRKRLSKTELKKDPVYDNLEAGLVFIKARYKELLGGLLVVLLAVIAINAITTSSKRSEQNAMAGFITASGLYDQALQFAAGGDLQSTIQALDACNAIATETWNQHPQRSWGRRCAVISAKVMILQSQNDQAIALLGELLATRPARDVEIAALIHMATALENRGSPQDLENAEESYNRLLELTEGNEDFTLVTAETMKGLSRVAWAQGDAQGAAEWLSASLELNPDTTEFVGYQLARLNQQ